MIGQNKLLEGEDMGKLNEVIVTEVVRPNGSVRVQQDFSNCPSMCEQHTAHLTDINYLIKKYKPDELAAYMAARNQYRQEILGHDFSQEPDLQNGMNAVLQSKKNFEALPEKITSQFKNHLEFLKFVDIQKNADKLIELGLLTRPQLDSVQISENGKLVKDAKADEVRGQPQGQPLA